MKFNTPPRSKTNELLHLIDQWLILQTHHLDKADRALELKCEKRIAELIREIARPEKPTVGTRVVSVGTFNANIPVEPPVKWKVTKPKRKRR